MKSDQNSTSPQPLTKEALVNLIIKEVVSCSTSLDVEDQEMLNQYGLGNIAMAEMMVFFHAKAQRLTQQIAQPQ